MENKVLDRLKSLVRVNESMIKPIRSDKRQFELNCRSEFTSQHLMGRIIFIEEHFNMIGKEVYKYVKSETYVLSSEVGSLSETHLMFNKLENEPLIFTIEMFDSFLNSYLQYQIDYLINGLLENSITSNSTHKLSNLVFEWELECKQNLIETYKKLL